MRDEQRHKRLRLLIKNLNSQRKKQAKQIDILCNDLIGMQRGFINTLNRLAFTADFCESIIGHADLQSLLAAAAKKIAERTAGCNVVFFLSDGDDIQTFAFEQAGRDDDENLCLEQHFSPELIEAVTKANKLCDMQELLSMGLQVGPKVLKDIHATTIPLSQGALAGGFILLYAAAEGDFQAQGHEFLCTVRRALSQAIRACAIAKQSSN